MQIKHVEIRHFRGIESLSWKVDGNFNCIIGPGDSCKTTILTALDYALSPRISLAFDDSDFFNQDVTKDIVIQITFGAWDENRPEIKSLFQENRFAQYKCGLGPDGPIPEPVSDSDVSFSLSLRVDKNLEPKWSIVRGRDDHEDQDRKSISATDRAVLGLSRIDIFSDVNFTWGRNSLLTRLTDVPTSKGAFNTVLSQLTRQLREADFSGHKVFEQCQIIADGIKQSGARSGVRLDRLNPRIDVQRQSLGSGAISLHEENVPIRNKGSGSKKLIGLAMQMKFHDGKNISVIDELEVGLEPHRIRGLIHNLKKSGQQIFTTTHSPVVLRELNVLKDELYFCKRDDSGRVTIENMNVVPDIQGRVRANAEAFLSNQIIVCEGSSEIGCLRAYDLFRLKGLENSDFPVWSLATAYFDAKGVGQIKVAAEKLRLLGYRVAVFCDNDTPKQLSSDHVASLVEKGISVFQWKEGNSIERQLLTDLPWDKVPELIALIPRIHDSLEVSTIIDKIRKHPKALNLGLDADFSRWGESNELRSVIGEAIQTGEWIKRIDYSEKVFEFALPLLPENGLIIQRLSALWSWVQNV